MTARETYYTTGPLYLHPNGIEMEHDALWRITVETYPAEPTSWGQSRGWETEVSAELIRWSVDRTRDDAVAIEGGEAGIIEQEAITAETFDWREAAQDRAEEWAEYQRDLRMDMAAE